MLKVVILLMTYLRKPVFQTKSEDLNRRFKSKRVQHGYRKKSIKNFNKAYIMRM